MLTPKQKTWAVEFLAAESSVDAIECTRQYCKDHDEHIDWHQWADYLDALFRKGIAIFGPKGFDGFTRYRLNCYR